jgi:hypothetical protein
MRWIIIRVKQFQGPEPQKEVPIMDRFNSQWSALQSDDGDPSLNDDASSHNDDACYWVPDEEPFNEDCDRLDTVPDDWPCGVPEEFISDGGSEFGSED